MKKDVYWILFALPLGVWISVAYIRPDGPIPLSMLVLQLSGSRGTFPLGTSLIELLWFSLRLVPGFVFQALAGIRLYRNYCTASIYIFSRLPDRLRWYRKAVGEIVGCTALYELAFLGAVLVAAAVRFPIVFDAAGTALLAYHFLIYTLWLCAATLLVNLIAIFRGSSSAFVLVTGGQLLCVTFFLALQLREPPVLSPWQLFVLHWDPAARLVLSWQVGVWPLAFAQDTPYPPLLAERSVLYLFIFCLAIVIAGGVIVRRHDLLVTDVESGGI